MVSLHSTALALFALGGNAALAMSSTSLASAAAPTGTSYPSGFDMKTSWGNLSPYADATGFNVSMGYPVECELSQVHVLHRHAQRYPTQWPLDGGWMEHFGQKVANYSKKHPHTKVGKGALSFLNHWEYQLGENTLTPIGAATEAASGAQFWSMYGRLLYHAGPGDATWDKSFNVFKNGTSRPKPTFRTTSYPRILESARWWLSGFFGNPGANSSYSEYNLVVIPEEDNFNNTLSSTSTCSNGTDIGNNAVEDWVPTLTKSALKRFSRLFPDDFHLDAKDVYAMFNLCPYESAALGRSAFCSIFTEQEWRDFEYIIDLSFYGNFGWGSPSGRAQGIGYVQELAARLKSRLIYSSDSSINYTYDNNAKQFPLHQPLYMDMSHDNVITSVLVALGLDYFRYGPHGLPTSVSHAPRRNFDLHKITPFGARLYSEIWTCPKNASFHDLEGQMYKNPDLSSMKDTTDYIRFVLNNAPVPVDGLKSCEDSVNGFCPLKKFLREVPDLTEQAMYQEACFGNYNISKQVGNGQPRKS